MPTKPPRHSPLGAYTDGQRGSRQARGYDAQWQRLRRIVLQREPLCRMCAGLGLVTAATAVDHIETIQAAPHRRLDITNLQPLCASHHNKDKQRADRQQQRHAAEILDALPKGIPRN